MVTSELQGKQAHVQRRTSFTPTRDRRKRRSWLAAIGQGRSPASTRRRERDAFGRSKSPTAGKRFDVDSLSFSGLERQQSPKSPRSPSTTGDRTSPRLWSPSGNPLCSPQEKRGSRRAGRAKAMPTAKKTSLSPARTVDESSPVRSKKRESIVIPNVFSSPDLFGFRRTSFDRNTVAGDHVAVYVPGSKKSRPSSSPTAAAAHDKPMMDKQQKFFGGSSSPVSGTNLAADGTIRSITNEVQLSELLDPEGSTTPSRGRGGAVATCAADSLTSTDSLMMSKIELAAYWAARHEAGGESPPPDSDDSENPGENWSPQHIRGMLRISTAATHGSDPPPGTDSSAHSLSPTRVSFRSSRAERCVGGGSRGTKSLTPSRRGYLDARRRIGGIPRFTPGNTNSRKTGGVRGRTFTVSPGAISLTTPFSPYSHQGSVSPSGPGVLTSSAISPASFTSPTRAEGTGHNVVSPATARKFSTGRDGRLDSSSSPPCPRRSSRSTSWQSSRALNSVGLGDGRLSVASPSFSFTWRQPSLGPLLSPGIKWAGEVSPAESPSHARLRGGWHSPMRGVRQQRPGFGSRNTSGHTDPPSAASSSPGRAVFGSTAASAAAAATAGVHREWISSSVSPTRARRRQITRGFMSPRLTVVRRSRSRTVGSDTIASASSLPIIVGRQQSSSPERTTPEKKPPCVSNDSPERTGNSNDSRGRENVCDVSEMYEFLDTTRSAGGRKTFDEASGAGDRDSITTFAGTVVEESDTMVEQDKDEDVDEDADEVRSSVSSCPTSTYSDLAPPSPQSHQLSPYSQARTSTNTDFVLRELEGGPARGHLSPYSQARTSTNNDLARPDLNEIPSRGQLSPFSQARTSTNTDLARPELNEIPSRGPLSPYSQARTSTNADLAPPELNEGPSHSHLSPFSQALISTNVDFSPPELEEGLDRRSTGSRPPCHGQFRSIGGGEEHVDDWSPFSEGEVATAIAVPVESRGIVSSAAAMEEEIYEELSLTVDEAAKQQSISHAPPGVCVDAHVEEVTHSTPRADEKGAEVVGGGDGGGDVEGEKRKSMEMSSLPAASAQWEDSVRGRRNTLLVSTPTGDGGTSDLSLWVTTRRGRQAVGASSSPDSVLLPLGWSGGAPLSAENGLGSGSDEEKLLSGIALDDHGGKTSPSTHLSPSGTCNSSFGYLKFPVVVGNDPWIVPRNGAFGESPPKSSFCDNSINIGGDHSYLNLDAESEATEYAGSGKESNVTCAGEGFLVDMQPQEYQRVATEGDNDELENAELAPLMSDAPVFDAAALQREWTESAGCVMVAEAGAVKGWGEMWQEISRALCGLFDFCNPPARTVREE